jgi:hypothetical protein
MSEDEPMEEPPMRFGVLVIIPAHTSDIVRIVEHLMAPYDLERPVAPYRVDIPVEERGVVAQRHGLLPDDPEMRDNLSDWYGSPCYQDEQGYYYVSSENPHGYWDGWILHDVQTDVYRLPDASMSGIDPLAVLTPDGVWHEMPYRWNETTQQTAQRQHLVEQVLAHYPAYLAVRLDCHR